MTNLLTENASRHGYDKYRRMAFFTDTSVCIGCKACEVACKERNHNPQDGDLQLLGSSYDNTGALGASTWRHVAFIEQDGARIEQARVSGRRLVGLHHRHRRRRLLHLRVGLRVLSGQVRPLTWPSSNAAGRTPWGPACGVSLGAEYGQPAVAAASPCAAGPVTATGLLAARGPSVVPG